MYKFIATAGLLTLSACSEQASGANPAFASWNREAGSFGEVHDAGFGAATMNNMQIQSGQKEYTLGLAKKFAAEVPSTINFAFNSSVLDANARVVLTQQANWIRQFPEVRFRVYGHTDLVGSNAYNKRLGLRRAQAVVAYFASQGISRSRLEAVASFGETQPLVLTQAPERRNRRTVTQVSGFVKNHPGVLNGKYAAVIFRDYVASGQEKGTLSKSSGSGFTPTK